MMRIQELNNSTSGGGGGGAMAYSIPDMKFNGKGKEEKQAKDGFDEAFVPKPNVPRRYTIAQLLLLKEILPYVMCRRDRLKDNAFRFFLVKIKGLRNESTHDHIIDEYIIRKQVKLELAMRDKIKKGYQYRQHFEDDEQDLRVKALWVEIHTAKGPSGGYRNAYRPPKMSEEELEAAVTFGQRRKDMIEYPRYPPKLKLEPEPEPERQYYHPPPPNIAEEPSPPQTKTFEGPATKWGTPFGYRVENITPAKKPPPNLGLTSTGQDQLAYIQYMLQAPLAPVLTPDIVNSTWKNGDGGGSMTPEQSLKQSVGRDGIRSAAAAVAAAGSALERMRKGTPKLMKDESGRESPLMPILTPHVVKSSGHSKDGSKTSISSLKGLEFKTGNPTSGNGGNGRNKSKTRGDGVEEPEAKAAKPEGNHGTHARTGSKASVSDLIKELELKSSHSRSSSRASMRDLDSKVVNSHSRTGSKDLGFKPSIKPADGTENGSSWTKY